MFFSGKCVKKNVHITFALLTRLWQVSQSSLHSQGAWRSRTVEPDPPLICCKQATWVSSVSVGGETRGTSTLHHGKQVEALRHLPAITENRCCDLTGQRARGPRFMANISLVSAWEAERSTGPRYRTHTQYTACSSFSLKFQLAGSKTPVTLRWRLHKPVK